MTLLAGASPVIPSTTARPADKGTGTLADALPAPDELSCRRLLALLSAGGEVLAA